MPKLVSLVVPGSWFEMSRHVILLQLKWFVLRARVMRLLT